MTHTGILIRVVLACALAFSSHAFSETAEKKQKKVSPTPSEPAIQRKISFEQYLRNSAVPTQTIDGFLGGKSWVKFDPHLGYTLQDYNFLFVWEWDKLPIAPITSLQPNGARTAFMYTNKTPRINTYGDSYTQSMQVGDGETWQEYLAGNLAEPIRNFGVGGYGVYQAYLRMTQEELTEHGAEYLILYICCNDSTRSLTRLRWAGTNSATPIDVSYPAWTTAKNFHYVAWPHLEMDLKSGRFVEKESILPTPELLHRLSDPQWMVDNLKDDLALRLALYQYGVIKDLDKKQVTELAKRLDFPFDWNAKDLQAQAEALLDHYSSRASMFVLDKARTFAREHGKKLMVVLNSTDRAAPDMVEGRPRFDQELVDYLKREKFDYFDMNLVHIQDFRRFPSLSYQQYMSQYFAGNGLDGHYSPSGNHFFAYAIKDKIVDWLNPKPITYINKQPAMATH